VIARFVHNPTSSGPQSMGDARGREHVRWLLFVVFYAIVANVPFWFASRWFGLLPLGWFCLEYAGIGLLALFVPPVLATVLLVVAIFGDLLSAVCKTYYLAPTECLMNLGALLEFPDPRLGAAVAVIAIILLIATVALTLPMAKIRGAYRSYAATGLIAFCVLSITADCAAVFRETGQMSNPFIGMRPGDSNKFSDYGNLWTGRYPLLRLVRDEELFGGDRSGVKASLEDSTPIASASERALRASRIDSGSATQQRPNVVLVLVESWGLDSDSAVRDALVQPYARPELVAQYEVSQGTVPFFGSTVGGESRELCGSEIGFKIENVSTQGLARCLPDRLASLGYRTIALHGMSGHMFNRQSWYRSIGFQEQWFRDSFRQRGLRDCVGAFVGTCDAAVADWLGRRLQTREASPDFAYWVTLNSHLPLPVPSGLPQAASCAITSLLSTQPTFCSWYQLVANVHDSVARLAMGELGRPTVFVIVGDHAPPFANPVLRTQFSGAEVPYVLLVPRQDNRAANDR
jgi:sulfatase-like protein